MLTAQLTPGNDVVTYTTARRGRGRRATGRYSGRVGSRLATNGRSANDSTRRQRHGQRHRPRLAGARLAATSISKSARSPAARAWKAAATAIGGSRGRMTRPPARIYSVYAGPTVQSQCRRSRGHGAYRFGYTSVEAPDRWSPAPRRPSRSTSFDESLTQSAQVARGLRPAHGAAVVGVGVGGRLEPNRTYPISTSASTTAMCAPTSPCRSRRRSPWSAASDTRTSRFRAATRCATAAASR